MGTLMILLLSLPIMTAFGMIDIASERLLTLTQLAKHIPRRRKDRPVHPSTIHRWRHPGVRGIRLECLRVGGAWCTTWESFQRFCECLTAAEKPHDVGHASPPILNAQRADKGHQERIDQELKRLGF